MSAEASSGIETSAEGSTPQGNRWSSWLLLAAITLPMIMAYVVFSTGWGIPTDTINKGDLVVPATSIEALPIVDREGRSVDLLSGKKMWRWLIVGNNQCDDQCQNNLYLSRQVHIRLGEKAIRLERLYLNTEPRFSSEFSDQLSKEHPKLKQLHIDAGDWSQLLSATSASESSLSEKSLFVVDQEGFVMMSYDRSHAGADLLDDIKRLLKYSYSE
ncbi:MAG: hypothetical protein CL693_14500 [Cellvibrionaceae bacterium]|nr:hypothetical protein [Cellvibrionaceae bacterium]|tara:strand:+ start:2851 stop:3495 length:645 start_codon:yes stop_codon:yes gene_type:complete